MPGSVTRSPTPEKFGGETLPSRNIAIKGSPIPIASLSCIVIVNRPRSIAELILKIPYAPRLKIGRRCASRAITAKYFSSIAVISASALVSSELHLMANLLAEAVTVHPYTSFFPSGVSGDRA